MGSFLPTHSFRSSSISKLTFPLVLQYTIVFCTCDVISLVVQAIGGGSAAVAVQSSSLPRKDPNVGARIMVGCVPSLLVSPLTHADLFLFLLVRRGIIFQMAVVSGSVFPSPSQRQSFVADSPPAHLLLVFHLDGPLHDPRSRV